MGVRGVGDLRRDCGTHPPAALLGRTAARDVERVAVGRLWHLATDHTLIGDGRFRSEADIP
jgi:hypothetical protein